MICDFVECCDVMSKVGRNFREEIIHAVDFLKLRLHVSTKIDRAYSEVVHKKRNRSLMSCL